MARKTEGAFVCEECGRSFSMERALTRHQNYAHKGGQDAALTDAQAGLDRLAAPLRAEAVKYEAELAKLNQQRDTIMAKLGPIQMAIKRLEAPYKKSGVPVGYKGGPSAKPKAKVKGGQKASVKAVTEVLDFLKAHQSQLADGFIGPQVMELINANGSEPPISKDRLRLALAQLHDQGDLRLLKKTQGGGKLYQLTAAGGGQGQ